MTNLLPGFEPGPSFFQKVIIIAEKNLMVKNNRMLFYFGQVCYHYITSRNRTGHPVWIKVKKFAGSILNWMRVLDSNQGCTELMRLVW